MNIRHVIMLVPVLACSTALAETTLSIYTWPDYIDPKVITEFTQQTGIRVHEIHYDSDDLKTDTLITTEAEGFDLMISSGYTASSYVGKGWLHEFMAGEIPNARNVPARWYDAYPAMKNHGVPYMWGTVGIAYRKDHVQTPVTSWQALMSPHASLKGRILMFDDSVDMLAIALKSIGQSMMSGDPGALRAAETLLMAQKPFVKRYGYEELSEDAALVSGEIWMTAVYNGDGLLLESLHPEIEFVVPEEGSSVWVDYISILEKSPNKKAAASFIDFINQPDVAARLSVALNFATPNEAGYQKVPQHVKDNPDIYLPKSTLEKSEVIQLMSDSKLSARNALADRITR